MAILVQSNKKPSVSFPSQTGSIVTFNSQYAGLPLKSHKIALTATQSGSGTPSPDNVRAISGFDSMVVKASSHSTVIETLTREYVDTSGIVTPSINAYPYKCVIARVKQGETYTYSVNGIATFIPVIAF